MTPQEIEKAAEALYIKERPKGLPWWQVSKWLKDEYREQVTRAPR